MSFFLTGAFMLSAIIGLFWLKDYLQSPLLARIAYSNLIARLAVIGAVFSFFTLPHFTYIENITIIVVALGITEVLYFQRQCFYIF